MTEPTRPCGTCGMPCTPCEYHPYAACLMFKACHNSEAVRANLNAVHGKPVPASAAEFALRALVAAGHVTQERVDQAMALPGAPAQPVACEPLTDEQIRAMCKEPWIFDTAKQWVRLIEAAHGITGGQHGAE